MPIRASLILLLALPLAAVAAPWKIYLLFGQSNMTGGAAPGAEDVFNNPRVKVLAYNTCSGRTYNEWYTATGGLHCGTGFGIGDWFGKVVADSLKQDTLALIPCAIAGVDIDFFRKGVVSTRRKEFQIPPDNKDSTAYDYMVRRLKKAQEKGVMAGILLHQGESDWTAELRQAWQGKVTGIISDLKKDLSFGDVPVLIGELRADAAGCCAAHNPVIAKTAQAIPNGHVVSSANLTVNNDAYHFNGPGLREFGKRFAAEYLKAPKPTGLVHRFSEPGTAGPGTADARRPRLSRGSSGAWILEFDMPQERIQVRDIRGQLIAEGTGRMLRLPVTAGRGLLFYEAAAGAGSTRGAMPDLR